MRHLTRRQFIVGAAAVTLSASCSSRKPAPPTPGTTALDPWSAWEELRGAVRRSPDHLVGMADRLVEAGDAEDLLAFVRDRVTTYPSGEHGWVSVATAQRWGAAGTLRGGAGTPREKAELLVELSRRAGLEARVVLTPAPADPASLLRRSSEQPFGLDIDDDRLAELLAVFGLEPARGGRTADANGADSRAVADRVLAAMPVGLAVTREGFAVAASDEFPNVVVTVGGAERLADLWSDAGLGETRTVLADAPPADAPLAVRATLSLARRAEPRALHPVVEGSWTADELVGGIVSAAFVPAIGDLDLLLGMPPRSIMTRIPTFTVSRPGVKVTEDAVVTGLPVTISGDMIDVDGDGIQVSGETVGTGSARDAERVSSIEAVAIGAAFPVVTLRLWPTDDAGDPVIDLPASAFEIHDGSDAVPFQMRRSHAAPARVLLLLDTSDSIPPEFRGAGAGDLVRRLAEPLLAADDELELRVAAVTSGRASSTGAWSRDPEMLARDASEAFGLGSQLWESLANAASLGATVVVFVTDGVATDENDQPRSSVPPLLVSAVSLGPPVVVVGVGPVDQPTAEALAGAGRGSVVLATSSADAAAAVLDQLEATPPSPYEITYVAAPTSEEVGTASARVGTAQVAATYDIPPLSDRAAPEGFSAIVLTVAVGDREVSRVIAGEVPDRDDFDVPANTLSEVREALAGRYAVSFEGAAPSLAHVLDGLITARIESRELAEASAGTDRNAILRALGSITPTPPVEASYFARPLPADDATLTYESALRVAVFGARTLTRDGTGHVRSWADILPLTRFSTASDDPIRRFEITARRSARLALIEGALYPDSTIARLGDVSLTAITGSYSDELEEEAAVAFDAMFADWESARPLPVVPSDGSVLAGWAVDQDSGTMWGVLEAGTGGGEAAGGASAFDEARSMLDWAAAASDVAGLAGVSGLSPAFGVWIQLEKTMVDKLEAADAIIGGGTVSGEIEDLRNLGCNVAVAGATVLAAAAAGRYVGESARWAVEAFGAADSVSGAAGGPSVGEKVCG